MFQKNNLIRGQPHENIEISATEELVLLAISGKELYGLQIQKAVEDASYGKRQLGIGSLYPILHRLEKKGLIESRWGDERPEERAGARRRYYRLTGEGTVVLEQIQLFRANLLQWQPV